MTHQLPTVTLYTAHGTPTFVSEVLYVLSHTLAVQHLKAMEKPNQHNGNKCFVHQELVSVFPINTDHAHTIFRSSPSYTNTHNIYRVGMSQRCTVVHHPEIR